MNILRLAQPRRLTLNGYKPGQHAHLGPLSARQIAPGALERCSLQARSRRCIFTARASGGTESPTSTVKLMFLNQSVNSKLYLGLELVELLILLGVVDAAYSGDWSRIGVISKDTELLLQQFVLVATAGHAVCALLAAWRASSTPGMNAGVAALKGFFFGALGVNEVFSSAEAGDQLRRMEK